MKPLRGLFKRFFETSERFRGGLLGRAAGQDLVCLGSTFSYRVALQSQKSDCSTIERSPMVKSEMLNLLNTLAHEILHIYALDHCAFYQCTMAAGILRPPTYGGRQQKKTKTKTKAKSKALTTTMGLCPVCIRKFKYVAEFTSHSFRYRQLENFYASHEYRYQAEWCKQIRSIAEREERK